VLQLTTAGRGVEEEELRKRTALRCIAGEVRPRMTQRWDATKFVAKVA